MNTKPIVKRRAQTLAIASCCSLFVMCGCAAERLPEQTIPVSNNAFSLDELFTDKRGNTVYRFYDQGEYRYYVVGPNGAQMLPTTKTVTVTETQTVEVDSHGGDSHSGHKK